DAVLVRVGGHGLPFDNLSGHHRAIREGQLHHALGPEESHPVADDERDETHHEQEGKSQGAAGEPDKGLSARPETPSARAHRERYLLRDRTRTRAGSDVESSAS